MAERLRIWLVTNRGRSRDRQVITVALVLALSVGLTVTSSSFVNGQNLLGQSSKQLRALQEAYAALAFEAQLTNAASREQIAGLRARIGQREAMILELTAAKASLQDELRMRERELGSIAEQRDATRALAHDIEQAVAGVENTLAALIGERTRLRRQLEEAKAQLIRVGNERDASRRAQNSLRARLARLEKKLESLRRQRDSAQLWLKEWVDGSVEALEEVFDEAGVDLEKLIARAANRTALGQGGPLQVAAPNDLGPDLPDDHPIIGDIQRLALLQRIARTMPLASPLDQFQVTSHYGKRRDPFTKSWAYHSGLDLGAPRNSEVLATAPGRVVFAGRSGPYGKMVELDHGMGIMTRYAHLESIDVEVGEAVELRTPLGVIGSTGRSTARHLHYEIRIDDRALDPAKFLDAGRLAAGIFDASARQEAD